MVQRALIWAFLALLSVVTLRAQAAEQPAIVATFSLEDAQPMVFSPVVLRAKLANKSDQEIRIHPKSDQLMDYKFDLFDSLGNLIQSASPTIDGFYIPGKTVLPPRGVAEEELLLNEWFDLVLPGAYRIRVDLSEKIDAAEAERVRTNFPQTVDLSLRPYSREELERICSALLVKAKNGAKLAQALEAARRLTSIRHPDAVPFLDQMLKIPDITVQFSAASALFSIGDTNAVYALIRAHREAGLEPKKIFKSVLMRLRHKLEATEPELSRAIDNELKMAG
jgi:hypothetical protein